MDGWSCNSHYLPRFTRVALGSFTGLAEPDAHSRNNCSLVSIKEGWQEWYTYSGRDRTLGGVSDSSLRGYKNRGQKHLEYCKKNHIKTWNQFDDNWLSKYAKFLVKYAPSVKYDFLAMVKMANRRLVTLGRLSGELLLKSPLSKSRSSDRYCYSRKEVAAMINHCMSNPDLVWMGRIILVLSHTGLRISELMCLRVNDIDWRKRTILITDERWSHFKNQKGTARTTKSSRSRRIPIHPNLDTLLKQIIKANSDGYLLRNANGDCLMYSSILNVFKDEVVDPLKDKFPTPENEKGFEHGRFHSFRHFFCSQCFISGASEGEVKEWLGHSDSKMLERYQHVREEESRQRMNHLVVVGEQDYDNTPKETTTL